MAEKHSVLQNVVAAGIVGLIAWLWVHRNDAPSSTADETGVIGAGDNSGFYSPYYYTNAGIPDSSAILNGGPPFQSAITINVGDALYGSLSNQYIPTFGFVGVTAVGG